MSLAAARVVAAGVEAYLAAGVLFALAFLPRAAARVDPALARSPVAVRILLAPGVVLLWPVLSRRCWRAAGNAGRRSAEASS
jgi:hypothetical protein